MLLFLLIISYLFELIDIFNALPVRVIGTGYRLLWPAPWRQIAGVVAYGLPAMDGIQMAALSIGSPEPRSLSVGRRYSERDANGFAIRLVVEGNVCRWLATASVSD